MGRRYYKTGAKVQIVTYTTGRLVYEGEATVISPVRGLRGLESRYWVRFPGVRRTFSRCVVDAAQADPLGYIAQAHYAVVADSADSAE